MTSRTDFLAVLLRDRRSMDAERREFARRAESMVEASARGANRFDQTAYHLTMLEMERLFDEFYGRWPGDPNARFWTLILAECRAVRALAFRRAVQDVRRRLRAYPEILRAIREEAA